MSVATRLFAGLLLCSPGASAELGALYQDLTFLEPVADECGVPREHLEELVEQLARSWSGKDVVRPGQSGVQYWRERGVDIIPFCEFLLYESNLRELDDPKRGSYLRSSAIAWLGQANDSRTVDILLRGTKFHILSPERDEYVLDSYTSLVYRFLGGLASTGDDTALDFLFWLQSDDFWRSEHPLRRAIEANWKPVIGGDRTARGFRVVVLFCVAKSGTERALKAFASGEGIGVTYSSDYLLRTVSTHWHGVPDIEQLTAQGLSNPALHMLRELKEWCDEASKLGLGGDAAKLLKEDLESPLSRAQVRRRCEYWGRQEFSIVPFLRYLREQEAPPGIRQDKVVFREKISFWLAVLDGK